MAGTVSQNIALIDGAERSLELLLAPYLNNASETPARLSESDVRQISTGLRRMGKDSWAKVPRLYAVLRMVDHVQVIESFLNQGVCDIWFPFSHKTLPECLRSASTRFDFLRLQDLVLTKAFDLEREDGKHRHFSKPEDIPLQKLEELGKGGFGYVDRVLSTVTYREYARKLIPRGKTFKKNSEVLRDFERELGTLKKLSHIHIVELIGSYTDPKFVGILMSPVADFNLKDFLARDSLTAGERSFLRTFFGCLASALSYLHENKIRHKDIKPQNVLVNGHQVFLTDFGISLDWSELGQSVTTGVTVKTPRYCAPEVADYLPRNSLSDMWSLGCVFLEIWTVLKGETTNAIFEHLETRGTKSTCYYLNHDLALDWCAIMEDRGSGFEENPPVAWIRGMLQPDQDVRWTAQTLVTQIQEANENANLRYAFSGVCCISGDDSTDSDRSSKRSSMILEETGASSIGVYEPRLSNGKLEIESLPDGIVSSSPAIQPSRLPESGDEMSRSEQSLNETIRASQANKVTSGVARTPNDEDTSEPRFMVSPRPKPMSQNSGDTSTRRKPVSRHVSAAATETSTTLGQNRDGEVTIPGLSQDPSLENSNASTAFVEERDLHLINSTSSTSSRQPRRETEENPSSLPTVLQLKSSRTQGTQELELRANTSSNEKSARLPQRNQHQSFDSDVVKRPLSVRDRPSTRPIGGVFELASSSLLSEPSSFQKESQPQDSDSVEDGGGNTTELQDESKFPPNVKKHPFQHPNLQESQTQNREVNKTEEQNRDDDTRKSSPQTTVSKSTTAFAAHSNSTSLTAALPTKRLEIVTDILESQTRFHHDMRVLNGIYQETASCAISKSEEKILFGNHNEILEFSSNFLDQLNAVSLVSYDGKSRNHKKYEKAANADTKIGLLFHDHFETLKRLYERYYFHASMTMLKTLQKRPSVREWLKECDEQSKDITVANGIETLLRAPLDQINRYNDHLQRLREEVPKGQHAYFPLLYVCSWIETLSTECRRDLLAHASFDTQLSDDKTVVKSKPLSDVDFAQRFNSYGIQSLRSIYPSHRIHKKAVFVGDGASGTTALIMRGTENKFWDIYRTSILEPRMMRVDLGFFHIELFLCETGSESIHDRHRRQSYLDANVVVLEFSIDNPDSLDNIDSRWLSEVKNTGQDIPIVLAGYKLDLRTDASTIEHLGKFNQTPVSYEDARKMAQKFGAKVYVECSAWSGQGLQQLFEAITMCAILSDLKEPTKKSLRFWKDRHIKVDKSKKEPTPAFSIPGFDSTSKKTASGRPRDSAPNPYRV